MKKGILDSVEEAARAIAILQEEESVEFIERVVSYLVDCFSSGGKVLIAGNGGSLCDAMHFAEEFTGFYREKRRPFPAMALADPSHMSCVANDTSFEEVFSRCIEAFGKREDLFIALTTSGNSKNLVRAAKAARERGIKVIGFLGKEGGVLKEFCDDFWIVNGFSYSDRIQEAHMAAMHIIIEAVEKELLVFV
ncbi:MAG: SIS domain-containing protein [Chlamydiae bacterium]|jgi:D-sedoheptulose 7-phosphate isomerase|nr:SIS domain-containing protein [Chlamydiota bacterium]